MKTDDLNDFFTPKHQKLYKVSKIANTFAWVALVIFTILTILDIISSLNLAPLMANRALPFNDLLRYIPQFFIRSFVSAVNYFLKGILFWIILKGISLGLNMVIETDLNFREKQMGESHE
jgi:hypothetical protein